MLDGAWLGDENGAGRDVLLCFSHLRWDFVFQRPQHLLTRAARIMQVIYWEEPVLTDATRPSLRRRRSTEGVLVVQPCLPHGLDTRSASLWAVLGVGVLVLGGVAWSLLRQLQRDGAPPA